MPFREMTRDQMWLLFPTLDELIPADHPVRFVAEFMYTLDREEWAELGVDMSGEAMGAPANHPLALLSMWVYGFMTNVRSCRKREEACRDQLPYLWLTGWQHPDPNFSDLLPYYQVSRKRLALLMARMVAAYRQPNHFSRAGDLQPLLGCPTSEAGSRHLHPAVQLL